MKKISQKKINKLVDERSQFIVDGMMRHICLQPLRTRLRVCVKIITKGKF